ncbi:hypothetical protein [Providencia sp. PROV079]|uniref:hypothetical protein n=1 Tax=Providencia sp. PROV079 TaxID=2949800 RepID=UPI002349DF5D|nr:hypothetical protein [Providencia sp. PROV079]
MKRYLSYIKKIAKQKNDSVGNSIVKRVMWRSLENRLKEEFEPLKNNEIIDNSFEKIYFSNYMSDEIKDKNIMYYNVLNAAQVHCGNRTLPCDSFILDENNNGVFSQTKEGGAAIWYTQTYDGRVLTFISPYKNDFTKANENELLINIYNHPQCISRKKIRKNFKLFFKYALATSAENTSSTMLYLFRLKLLFIDLNFRNQKKINSYLYGFFILFFAAIAAFAALLAL